MDSNTKQSELKRLIIKGREQGFLTYREINDHLPDDMNDTDQIEAVVNMINEMGIEVYDAVPDADSLLLKTADNAPTDEVDEETDAALKTAVENEFGRTTDPVRMYMREMGTVDLLTRQDEIRLADHADMVKDEEMRLTDLLAAFIDPNEEINENPPQAGSAKEESDDDEEEEEAPVDTGPDFDEAMERLGAIRAVHEKYLKVVEETSYSDPKARALQEEMIPQIMEIKFTPKIVEKLWDSIRTRVETIRMYEKQIMDFSIKEAGIARKDFIKIFLNKETDSSLYETLVETADDKGKALFEENKKALVSTQRKLQMIETLLGVPTLSDFNCKKIHQPRFTILRLNSRRQHWLDEGSRQI